METMGTHLVSSGGGSNTQLFHRKATRRRSKNTITHIARHDGIITEDVEELKSMTTSFYQMCTPPRGNHWNRRGLVPYAL